MARNGNLEPMKAWPSRAAIGAVRVLWGGVLELALRLAGEETDFSV